MNPIAMTYLQGPVVEEDVRFTLAELCQACSTEQEHVLTWILEGVLEPLGDTPQDWRFSGESLHRVRLAMRLSCDLEINPPGVALALDLLDEIAVLRGRLERDGLD